MKDFSTLIIPDVHGRDFWRAPVMKTLEESNAHIVFLGDYVDPYPGEWITGFDGIDGVSFIDYEKKAYDTLVEIIELKKKFSDRITLLLGNHDCGYIDSKICSCRRDILRYNKIHNLFEDNWNEFQLAYDETVNGKHIIYSHAGISRKYAEFCFGKAANEDDIVDMFNNAYRSENWKILGTLEMYDYYRGYGGNDFASLIWADIEEWAEDDEDEDEDSPQGYGYMIFGHSQLRDKPIIRKHIADLDCRRAFVLDNEGNIKEYLEME